MEEINSFFKCVVQINLMNYTPGLGSTSFHKNLNLHVIDTERKDLGV